MKELVLFLSIIWGDATTDQERCQAEADFMAKHEWLEHVGPTIGKFEGIGWGCSDKPSTCTPSKERGLQLSGDATAVTKSGIKVRVRSWR